MRKSILYSFLKNQVAFYCPEDRLYASAIQPDDLIAISDGYKIVVVANAVSYSVKLAEVKSFS